MMFAKVTDRYSADEIATFYETGQWRNETLFEVLERQVEAQPDRVFLTDDTRALTFRQLRDRGLRLAVGLHRWGLRAGDRVTVQLPNWTEFAVITLALSRIGAIMVPIMPIYRRDEVAYISGNAGARLAFTAESFNAFDYPKLYADIRSELPALEDVVVVRGSGAASQGAIDFESLVVDTDRQAAAAEIGERVGPDEPFVVVYSSGTTSFPKGCLHTFNTMGCGARILGDAWGVTPDDVQFGPSPVTHTTGLVTSIIVPLIRGSRSHIMQSWEPRLGLEQIKEHRCTITVNATTFLQMALDVYDPEVHDASSMRVWVAAGAPIPASVIERAATMIPAMKVLSLYGRTENITTTMCRPDDEPRRSLTSDGKALPLQSVRIVDAEGNEVPRGQEGDIAYRGAMHMLEYVGKPVETAELFTPDGHSRSGDLGVMDEDGYVRVTGRTKDIVIRGGLNISVRQVEDLLTAHPAVSRVAVVGMPDERLGERACCYLVPTAGNEGITLEDLTAYLLDQGIAKVKLPERLEIVDELPTTATGKIQKHVLRRMIAEKLSASVA
ncbi:MAG TPA: AMP-binding protein [Intrasporangium sp.]|uniref:AMP-binding protein n=1 Tax=Intrasporangium sp. TaxID=1925024 RepID=UPI002D78FB8A|nr:AMP-binding protein [Intrasporangium sp.]HET7399107.1 AMP-binding protein [Intrasporangium sp.]